MHKVFTFRPVLFLLYFSVFIFFFIVFHIESEFTFCLQRHGSYEPIDSCISIVSLGTAESPNTSSVEVEAR